MFFPVTGRIEYNSEDLRGQSAVARSRPGPPARSARSETIAIPGAQPAETAVSRALDSQSLSFQADVQREQRCELSCFCSASAASHIS